jgi:zinc and cadmium transporter
MISWIVIILFLAPFTGGLIALKSGYKNERTLKIFLAFAGGYIFSTTILHVLPEIFHDGNEHTAIIVLAGFFFQIFISRFSDGAEHGHLHNHHHDHSMALPIGLFISMCIHAFTEGLPLGIMSGSKAHVNQSMSIGIAMHELPAAFALMSILQSEHIKKNTVWILLFVYASMAPLGLTLSYTLSSYLPEFIFTRLLAFVAGIFLYVSTTILFENSDNHQFNGRKLMAVLAGVAMALVIGSLIH